ncbi:MAG: transporter substrate-binding domain-containing protein [Spirochaetes bacterium]|nr:transporter substrate-binding domain-containing protein [Spirochaetota bacterium]MBU1081497.1 transporter substrate-binding domain-containing protein [Spirochaetota bacterium]
MRQARPTALASLLALALCASCAAGLREPSALLSAEESAWLEAHRDELAYAPDPAYAPFEFTDASDGRTKGLAYDYFALVEKKLGIRFRRLRAPSFARILEMAEAGEVSAVNAATATPERSEYLLFTRPFIEVKNVIVTRKSARGVRGAADLAGLRVSMVEGYAVTEYLSERLGDIDRVLASSDLQALLDVAYGVSDAAVLDLATASYLVESEGISNISVSGEVDYPIRLSIGSRKDMPELNSILSKGIAAISPREHVEIVRKWINLENEAALDRREVALALAVGGLGLLAVACLAVAWNVQLKRQIAVRTAHLDEALAYKEALLHELFHRTRNNMQVIISMIDLRVGIMDDTEARRSLGELQGRIRTMAMVEQRMYESNDLSSLDLGRFVIEVVQLLIQLKSVKPDAIRFELDVQALPLVFDLAVPFGLVLYELVDNALTYAFPAGRTGVVRVGLRRLETGSVELVVADDGVGPPPGMDLRNSPCLGMQVAVSLVESQLGGTIEFSGEGGLRCAVRFDDSGYGPRV